MMVNGTQSNGASVLSATGWALVGLAGLAGCYCVLLSPHPVGPVPSLMIGLVWASGIVCQAASGLRHIGKHAAAANLRKARNQP